MNRFETEFGDTGIQPGMPCKSGSLQAFDGRYRFQDRTFSITVWARDWEDAERYCKQHGLKLDGMIEEVL